MGNIPPKLKRKALELEATQLLEQSIITMNKANDQLAKLKHLLDKLGARDYTTNCVGETVPIEQSIITMNKANDQLAKNYERIQYNKFVEEFKSYQDTPVDTNKFDESD